MKREYKFHILHKMQKVELGIMIYIRKRPRSHAYLVYLLTTKGKTLYIYMYITYIYIYVWQYNLLFIYDDIQCILCLLLIKYEISFQNEQTWLLLCLLFRWKWMRLYFFPALNIWDGFFTLGFSNTLICSLVLVPDFWGLCRCAWRCDINLLKPSGFFTYHQV